jgi:hypothetical protein
MSNPKKRGRPSKADVAAKAATVEPVQPGYAPVMNGDTTHPSPQEVIAQQLADSEALLSAPVLETPTHGPVVDHLRESLDKAQAYAMRVWSGQAADIKRAERIARCERALQGQNLPTEGVLYPTGGDSEDWTEEDMQPVTWRKASA